MPDLEDDLQLALRLADAADAISGARFRANDLHVTTKPDRTHVTDADQAVERAIRELIAAERPGDAVLGEEYGSAADSDPRTADRLWIVDPIDGTHSYERGLAMWGTLVALAVDGEPVVGVASSPAMGKRWWASAGQGAWTSERAGEPQRLQVSGIRRLADAAISNQSIQQWDAAGRLDQLVTLSRSVWRDRAYGDVWAYTLLAEGMIEAVAEFGLHPYDIAALIPIIQEAGGRVSGAGGGPALWDGSAVASNGSIHEELLALLRS
ncbi:inositol monophosphatase family protein [Rathayibacter sp. KR2-224]|uniref:inositol monophosphatase family protein n=1 Tax=Rathayibacter sp. KR2-224 TaxID=3400913 RepID=UPI003C125880